ncbi:hypothetical protein MIND_01219200 [Mycena indigotica]|uniref:SHSP domain-containing protein n=1 Tax=Mycena indigotica TaxID=2126181 RepID=A0A8H6S3V4_9AGAR|nr:uncharacterized protein MIND_01219200 [Mycena indigotica]KAF7291937.1 hypothetical protein MIND_01219200 [Mycena indigotica]
MSSSSYLGQYTDDYAHHSAPPTPATTGESLSWDQHQRPPATDFDSQVVTPTQLHLVGLPAEPQHLVPTQVQARGTHDMTPVRLFSTSTRPPPVEIQPVMLNTPITRATARPASRARHGYHPYQRPLSDSKENETQFPTQSAPGRQRYPTDASPPSDLALHSTPTSPALFQPTTEERRYLIRTDTHYDSNTQILTAMLEVPGIKRQDIRITIGTTLFNRLRQVTVHGSSRACFPPPIHRANTAALRERKYGKFSRAFPVPEDTRVCVPFINPYLSTLPVSDVMNADVFCLPPAQPEDIDATMEDGVLVLRINCGVPALGADEHEIPIR